MLPTPRFRTRPGYSTIELIMVVVVIGALFAMTFPRFTSIRTSSTLRAGRQQLSSTFSTARASALLKGKTSTLTMAGSTVTVTVFTGLAGTATTVAGPVRFDLSGMTLEALGGSPTTVQYDARGQLTPIPPEPLRYRLLYAGKADTLCISISGLIMQRGCML